MNEAPRPIVSRTAEQCSLRLPISVARQVLRALGGTTTSEGLLFARERVYLTGERLNSPAG